MTTAKFSCASHTTNEMAIAKFAIRRGDIPKAIENLQIEISKNPSNGETYIFLAELRAMQGDLQTAIDLMRQARAIGCK